MVQMERVNLLVVLPPGHPEAFAGQQEYNGYPLTVVESIPALLEAVATGRFGAVLNQPPPMDLVVTKIWPAREVLARFLPEVPVVEEGGLAAATQAALAQPVTGRQPFAARLLGILWRAELEEALTLLGEARQAGLGVGAVYEEMLAPALNALGDWWGEGACRVYREHAARTIVERLVTAATPEPQMRRPERAVVACVPGDSHELGASMVTELLRIHGYGVRFLGARTPLSELVATIEAAPADVVALSATMPFDVAELEDTIVTLRLLKVRLVVLGGRGFQGVATTPTRSQDGAADGMFLSAREGVAFVGAQLRRRK